MLLHPPNCCIFIGGHEFTPRPKQELYKLPHHFWMHPSMSPNDISALMCGLCRAQQLGSEYWKSFKSWANLPTPYWQKEPYQHLSANACTFHIA
jgi:hypothetical protein